MDTIDTAIVTGPVCSCKASHDGTLQATPTGARLLTLPTVVPFWVRTEQRARQPFVSTPA